MFYTLASKISAVSGNSILRVFIFGSVLYVLLHYYINTSPNLFIFSLFIKYLYYLMAIDFAMAYFIIKSKKTANLVSSSVDEQDDKTKEEIENNIQELRNMQMMDIQRRKIAEMQQQQILLNKNNNKDDKDADDDDEKSQKSPFLTKNEVA